VREQRLALERQADVLQKEESALRDHLIASLPKSDATGVAGKVARASIKVKTIATAEDWDKVNQWCLDQYALHKRKKDGLEMAAFGIFQRRLSDAVVKERWDNGEEIPGVSSLDVKMVSLNKL
jgi:hypothetical protein